jgi:hypothetical protein
MALFTRKSAARKSLESDLLSLVAACTQVARSQMPPDYLQDWLESKGPEIVKLAQEVRDQDGDKELKSALKYGRNFADNTSRADYGGGRRGLELYQSAVSTLIP